MSKSIIPVNGEAMPKADRSKIIARAWDIFRSTYHYPQIKFSSIGLSCFASCLRRAWFEYRQAKAVEAIPGAERRARIKANEREIVRAQYAESYQITRQIEEACRAEIALLSGKGVPPLTR